MIANEIAHNTAVAALLSLKAHLTHWYHRPDFEALEIALSVAASHYTDGEPIWIFIVAPPATGKTAIVIQAITQLPRVHMVCDLTPNTLLSGKQAHRGAKPNSLLQQIGKSGILLMKDFTTVISKRPEERAILASQLREIYDGRFIKSTGMGDTLDWQGKITLIAATTPAIEREWSLMRDLGERFVTVRWEREDGVAAARQSLRQRGNEFKIGQATAGLAKELLSLLPQERPQLNHEQIERILAMSEIVALARNKVTRDSHGDRPIIDRSPAEGPSRIAKALCGVVVNYAALLNREVLDEDLRLATRVAMNSIPSNRYRLLSSIPADATIDISELSKLCHMPPSTIDWQLDELESLSLVSVCRSNVNVHTVSFTSELTALWATAFPPSH